MNLRLRWFLVSRSIERRSMRVWPVAQSWDGQDFDVPIARLTAIAPTRPISPVRERVYAVALGSPVLGSIGVDRPGSGYREVVKRWARPYLSA